MDGWIYFLQSSLDEMPSGWDILSVRFSLLVDSCCCRVTATDLGDCARSGAAVCQNSGSHSASWQAALKRSLKATRDTYNLSPL